MTKRYNIVDTTRNNELMATYDTKKEAEDFIVMFEQQLAPICDNPATPKIIEVEVD